MVKGPGWLELKVRYFKTELRWFTTKSIDTNKEQFLLKSPFCDIVLQNLDVIVRYLKQSLNVDFSIVILLQWGEIFISYIKTVICTYSYVTYIKYKHFFLSSNFFIEKKMYDQSFDIYVGSLKTPHKYCTKYSTF